MENKSELEAAKELVKQSEEKLQKEAIEIFNKAISEMEQLGYSVEPKTESLGNSYRYDLVLVKLK